MNFEWSKDDFTITLKMLKNIAEIDEFKGTWMLLGRLAPERLTKLKKVATIESIGSSTRIEGSKLSDLEVERLLSNLETNSFISRDEEEVAGYSLVCSDIFQSFESMNFSENIIKQLHSWLLKFSKKDQRHKGEYKKLSNNVEAFDETGKSLGIVFETTSPFDTPHQMQKLLLWVNTQFSDNDLHPLLIIGIFVVLFLAIHPFQDGNGRLSRVLTTLLLMKSGYQYVPYSSLESVIERNKENYYLALRKTQASLKTGKNDFVPWLTFFLESLVKQKTHLEIKVKQEHMFLKRYSKLEALIIQSIQDHGQLGVQDIERLTNANRNTIKKALIRLVSLSAIESYGHGRATVYGLL